MTFPPVRSRRVSLPSGGKIKVIAGSLALNGAITNGPINGAGAKISTDPLYLDVHLPAGSELTAPISCGPQRFPLRL